MLISRVVASVWRVSLYSEFTTHTRYIANGTCIQVVHRWTQAFPWSFHCTLSWVQSSDHLIWGRPCTAVVSAVSLIYSVYYLAAWCYGLPNSTLVWLLCLSCHPLNHICTVFVSTLLCVCFGSFVHIVRCEWTNLCSVCGDREHALVKDLRYFRYVSLK